MTYHYFTFDSNRGWRIIRYVRGEEEKVVFDFLGYDTNRKEWIASMTRSLNRDL